MHGAGGGVPLDDLSDPGERVAHALARGEREAEAAIARLVVGAGQHEVAEAGEPHEGLGLRSERHTEAHHLGQPARDQRDARVGAEAQAIGEAGAHREHVLDRATHLDADDVGGRVGTEVRGMQALRELVREMLVGGGDGHRGGQAGAHFLRERGAGEHRDGVVIAEHLVGHLVR